MVPEVEEQELLKKTEMPIASRRRRIGVGIIPLLIGAYVIAGLASDSWSPWRILDRLSPLKMNPDAAFAPTFDGDSGKLANTQVVPTLDTPIQNGKNVVWCATFPAAWKQGQQKVTKGPIQIAGAEDICARLNAAPDPASTLPAEALYANAGFFRDGIVETIQKEMGKRFPNHTLPDLGDAGGCVFYSYLTAHVPFSLSYMDNPNPLEFTAGNGAKTAVRSFGSSPSYGEFYGMRFQPRILMAQWQDTPDEQNMLRLKSFAVDLCTSSKPFQIVVARVPRKESLEATLDAVKKDIMAFSGDNSMFECVLQVPNMAWRLQHHYRELEGRPFENTGLEGMPVIKAVQDIQFQLDKNGARVDSEALVTAAAAPSRDNVFLLNGPFLLYIAKRGEATPFFVMWVDNAELLQRWGG